MRWSAGKPIRLFRRDTGVGFRPNGRRFRYGLVGAADLWGFLLSGLHVEIEVKTGSGRLTARQIAWRSTCERFGVRYILARSIADVEGLIS